MRYQIAEFTKPPTGPATTVLAKPEITSQISKAQCAQGVEGHHHEKPLGRGTLA